MYLPLACAELVLEQQRFLRPTVFASLEIRPELGAALCLHDYEPERSCARYTSPRRDQTVFLRCFPVARFAHLATLPCCSIILSCQSLISTGIQSLGGGGRASATAEFFRYTTLVRPRGKSITAVLRKR